MTPATERPAGPAWKPAGAVATAHEAGAWLRHIKRVTVGVCLQVGTVQFRGYGTVSPTCRRQGQPFLPSVPSSLQALGPALLTTSHTFFPTPVHKQAKPPPRKNNIMRRLGTHAGPLLLSCTPRLARHMSAAQGTKRHTPSAVPWPLSTLLHFVSLTQVAVRGPSLRID
ncbi:hypothetical protein GGP41_003081 [Bipolaris sorokiniana]|uniref:Uncharacterized protein n=1 Tax=Cochliobolus sativus TaxID=45130 RepID=A0A8H5Z8K7_COCSA|nr:hypothetical protein GGP41_003081 [Bipolaris sorokiniana]